MHGNNYAYSCFEICFFFMKRYPMGRSFTTLNFELRIKNIINPPTATMKILFSLTVADWPKKITMQTKCLVQFLIWPVDDSKKIPRSSKSLTRTHQTTVALLLFIHAKKRHTKNWCDSPFNAFLPYVHTYISR